MKMKFAIVAAALVGSACDNQATADLAVCKGDLTRSKADLAAAGVAADAKVAALEAQLKQVKDDSKKALEAEAHAAAVATQNAVKQAVVETTAKKADVKVTAPVKTMDTATKAKAAGF